ncbi:LOW QUALITY PROTEIN: ferric siderophore transport system, periplasmic binding protein TonB [Brevundimonas abyssalis TAR-001]|uniref:Ferric siderophore transport system, periplasmic binding protein TonB n=1 Tax=Brevundimonas abyssalis TAR-001 TaxID=1391729 RepID=A0A8E0TT15_9CAUL|nr:LOW QUALITY PROTEIN: ferric siderophore transport system, periplasmic binding protein TonB [Brevundimonas abyssalis TAR-001]
MLGVGLAHVALLAVLTRSQPLPPDPPLPPIEVFLVPPPEPEPEPPPPDPSPEGGGRAPAAPSVVHTPPNPPPEPPEIIAPIEQRPSPRSMSAPPPRKAPSPAWARAGRGPAQAREPARATAPARAAVRRRSSAAPPWARSRPAHPPGARSVYGRVSLSCVIRLDQYLDQCRVVSESPPGRGFGEAGLVVSRYFRFRPPTQGGRPVEGRRVVVGVDFGRPRR